MSNYFVIGNPIDHSLSPLIHNYWFTKYKIKGIYKKKNLQEDNLEVFVQSMRDDNVKGANVTVPFKKKIIPFLDELTKIAEETQSVNTITKKDGKLIGHNTDVTAFGETIKDLKRNENDKPLNSLIIGAGGVTPSILFAIKHLNNSASKIYITNRTKNNADKLLAETSKHFTENLKPKIVEWGNVPKDIELVVNTTSVGLIKDESLDLDFSDYTDMNNVIFYDLIYNPKETKFLSDAIKRRNKTINGKMMFLLQAKQAFFKWTNINVEIDHEVSKILDK